MGRDAVKRLTAVLRFAWGQLAPAPRPRAGSQPASITYYPPRVFVDGEGVDGVRDVKINVDRH